MNWRDEELSIRPPVEDLMGALKYSKPERRPQFMGADVPRPEDATNRIIDTLTRTGDKTIVETVLQAMQLNPKEAFGEKKPTKTAEKKPKRFVSAIEPPEYGREYGMETMPEVAGPPVPEGTREIKKFAEFVGRNRPGLGLEYGLARGREFMADPRTRIFLGELGAAVSPPGTAGERIGASAAEVARREIVGDIRAEVAESETPVESLSRALATPRGKLVSPEQIKDLASFALLPASMRAQEKAVKKTEADIALTEARAKTEEAMLDPTIEQAKATSEWYRARTEAEKRPDITFKPIMFEGEQVIGILRVFPDGSVEVEPIPDAKLAEEAVDLPPIAVANLINKRLGAEFFGPMRRYAAELSASEDPAERARGISLDQRLKQKMMMGRVELPDWSFVFESLPPELRALWDARYVELENQIRTTRSYYLGGDFEEGFEGDFETIPRTGDRTINEELDALFEGK